jgi:hypothetical protein
MLFDRANRQALCSALSFAAPLARAGVSAAAVAVLAACAPDAMRNYQATGFNGYLNTLKSACPNLRIGASDVGQWLQYGGGTNDYDYWLDMTSRLYYRRVSPAEYRSAVAAQLGASSANAAAFDCVIGNLPEQR